MWQDVIRYADSRGSGQDIPRTMWRYRDWIVDAFNADLPYDEFTIKQLAGDLIATAAHRSTQANDEEGTDDEEFRVAAVMDRVSTTWVTWQATTMECVQCHSHPYDPFRHEDYYKIYAFFNNTEDTDHSSDFPLLQVSKKRSDEAFSHEIQQRLHDARKESWNQLKDLEAKPSTWVPLSGLSASVNSKITKVHTADTGGVGEFHTSGTPHSGTRLTIKTTVPAEVSELSALKLRILPLKEDSAWASEWGFTVSHLEAWVTPSDGVEKKIAFARVVADEPHPFHDPQSSLDDKDKYGFSSVSRINHPRWVAFIPETAHPLEPGDKIRVKITCKDILNAAFPLNVKRGQIYLSDDKSWQETLSSPAFVAAQKQIDGFTAAAEAIPKTTVPVMRQRPRERERETALFVRGNWLDKGPVLTPGVPASFPPLPDGVPKDRLALANWLISGENPLTARVAVNRFWEQLFGTGIVKTLEDFGSAGELPSHPALLDHLALKFQGEMGWSMKSLLRHLVTSATYQQSGRANAEQLERDPENRLLARGPRNRLTAEMVRDQALATSGLLDLTIGGTPVFPHMPSGGWNPFNPPERDLWKTEPHDHYRRTLYTHWQRSNPHPLMAAFDAPIRDICSARRSPTNTPIQPLMTLNDRTFLDAARAHEVATDPVNQISHIFQAVTLRHPEPSQHYTNRHSRTTSATQKKQKNSQKHLNLRLLLSSET